MIDKNEVTTLIDKASKICGSKKALAEELGVMPQHIGQWASGARTCMPDDIAAMAIIAGFDAMQFLARATVQRTEGTKKGLVLARGLGKTLVAIGAVAATTGASARTVGDLIRCIKRLNQCRHFPTLNIAKGPNQGPFSWGTG